MRNLLGRLLDRNPNELARIATFWDVTLNGRDRYADVAAIYRTMTDVWAARDIWAELGTEARQLVSALHAHDGEARAPQAISEELGTDPEQTREELRRLYASGIVALEDEEEGMDGERALFLPREMGLLFARVMAEQAQPLDSIEPLEELLATVSYPEIEEAASRWGARVTPGIHARAELIKIISDQIERPERVDRYVSNLSGPARDVWSALRGAGGAQPLDEVAPISRLAPAERRRVVRELSTPLLVWHTYREDGDGARRMLVIPDAILNPTKPEPRPLPELQTLEASDAVEPEWLFPQAGAWDLLTILREVVVATPRWNALAEADPAISRRFRGRLWRSDRETQDLPTGYLAFLVRVGAMLGVLQDDDGRAAPGPEARNWRESAFTTAARKMVAAWTAAEGWVEGRDRVSLTLYGASWPAYRGTLLRALGQLEPDIWYDEASFVERLLRSEPDLLRQAQVGAVASSQLAMQLEQHGEVEDRRAHVLRLIIGTTLETAGVWLNLIERSQDLRASRAVFRLTPFGYWVAGPRSEPGSQQLGPAALSVGANFQVLLFRPTPRRVWALSAFAEQKALDRVSTYTLTASALIRALSSGVDLSDIVHVLESQSGQELPQTVAYTLQEWDRGYRRVWLRRSVLLVPEEGEDSRAIAEALQDAGLDPEILPDGRITLIYDAADAGERLYSAATRALRDRGFAPLTEPGQADSRRKN